MKFLQDVRSGQEQTEAMKQLLLPMDLPRDPTLREELALRGILSEGERRKNRAKHSASKEQASRRLESARLGTNALSLPE